MQQQLQHCKKMHTSHQKSANPQHNPTINKGTTTRPNKLEGARWDAEVETVAADVNDNPEVEAVHRCPYHMLEVHSWSCTFREEHSKDNGPHTKCIQTKQSGTQTRTCATRAVSMSKIGTQVQHANARSRDTWTASPVQTTHSTPK